MTPTRAPDPGVRELSADLLSQTRHIASHRLTRPDHLNVSELFGPTIQGEGRNAGQLSTFLRLAGCNLTCSWCDSRYTWDWENYDHAAEVIPFEIDDLAATLTDPDSPYSRGRLVVTGGEPLLQAPGLAVLLERLGSRHMDLETNGTTPLGATGRFWSTITCSPKVGPSAGQSPTRALPIDPELMNRADLKFVVADHDDLASVDAFVAANPVVRPGRVWLMPEGRTQLVLSSRLRWLGDAAVERGYNLSTRLHVYAWGDERGH